MWTRWLFASFHVLALGIGLGAVFMRGMGLRGLRGVAAERREEAIGRVLAADNAWGVAAVLWLVTGLWRAFGGLEKGTDWYLQNPLFHLKLALFVGVLILELAPMILFIRWRIARSQGQDVDTDAGARLARLNDIEVVITVAIAFVATALARGMA